jgi:hypothetical protein
MNEHLSQDIYATLRVDHKLVGQTEVKPQNQLSWDTRFVCDLDKVGINGGWGCFL